MSEPMTTAGLQAKVDLRRAWFAAHPDKPIPEAREEVEHLFAAIEAEAAQEAPAPEGLLRVAEAAEFLVGSIELGERRDLTLHAASQVNQALAALHFPVNAEGLIDWPKVAPPSPAEPPRPDHQHHYEHDFRCGTCGATFLAVLTDDRAEARPPEGLDPDRLARAIDAAWRRRGSDHHVFGPGLADEGRVLARLIAKEWPDA